MRLKAMREARERVRAIKLAHQHFQARKNPAPPRTASFPERRAS